MQNIINQQDIDSRRLTEGAFDISTASVNSIEELVMWHNDVCGCNQITTCIILYYRCVIKSEIYHSLNYPKRQSSISYFVQYTYHGHDSLFGSIEHFLTYKGSTFAFINNYPIRRPFSEIFASSEYHLLLSKCINSFFYILEANAPSLHYVPIHNISCLCVLFQKENFIIATPISEGYEHD